MIRLPRSNDITHALTASPVRVAFGERVRASRKERGFSQVDLAAACNLDRTYIGGIERGERNPSLENIAKIAKVLEMPIADLVKGIENGQIR